MFKNLKLRLSLSLVMAFAAGCSIDSSSGLNGKVNTQDKCGPAIVQVSEFDSCRIKLLAPMSEQELKLQPNGEYVFAFSYTGNCGANFDLLVTGNPFDLVAGTNLFRRKLIGQTGVVLAPEEPARGVETDEVLPSEPIASVGYFSVLPVPVAALKSIDGNYHWVVSANQNNPASTCFQKAVGAPL